jgi:hypothetical protein
LRFRIFLTSSALTIGMTAAIATVASARTIYEDLAKNMGWVPTSVAVAYEPGAEEVQVADGFIQLVHGGPISVKPTTDSDGVLALSWKLTLDDVRGNGVPVRYEIVIYKGDNRAKVRAEPLGFRNDWESRGSCKVSKG